MKMKCSMGVDARAGSKAAAPAGRTDATSASTTAAIAVTDRHPFMAP